MRLLHLGFVSVFFDRRSGEWRDLVEPEGLATSRQLYWLNAHGLLAVVEPGQVEPLSKGVAAYAIDFAERGE